MDKLTLRTPLKQAIEVGTVLSDGTVELLGVEKLGCINHTYACALKGGGITPECCLPCIFSVKDCFFYALEHIRDGKTLSYERGVGCLFKKNDVYFLERKTPLFIGENASNLSPCSGTKPAFSCKEGDHFIVYSTVPVIYAENLLGADYLISSVSPFKPHSFQVTGGTLVGNMGEGIGAFGKDSPKLSEFLAETLSRFTKQLTLKTSKLCAKVIALSTILLKKTSKTGIKEGGLIVDEADGRLKYYDGTKWKVIEWSDDEDT